VAATKYGQAAVQSGVMKVDSRRLAGDESHVVRAFVARVPVIEAQQFLVPVWPVQATRFSTTGVALSVSIRHTIDDR
jgi:hypothetical protein